VTSSSTSRREVLLEDDFSQGLDLTSTWGLLTLPPSFVADDGSSVSTSKEGLHVKAAGTNPQTGEPAFTKTSPGESDHTKWMADTQHVSSNSVPGFDAVPGQERMVLFTLLDGGLQPSGTGLVTLAPPYTFPTAFVGGPNLFGQGAELRVRRFEVDSVDAG